MMRTDPGIEGLPFVPYCGVPPLPENLLQAWNWDPILLACFAAAAILYSRWFWNARHGHRGCPNTWHAACFGASWLILFIALVSPLCNLTSALFSARVGQHLLMIQLAAPLLVLAWPRDLDYQQPAGGRKSFLSGRFGLAIRRWTALLSAPEIAWILHGIAIWTWHLPGPYEAALRHDSVLWVMHLSLFITALAAWHSLLRTDTTTQGRAIIATFGTSMHMGLLGAVLVFSSRPLFAFHYTTTYPWGLTPLEDQQLGALIMWVLGCSVYTLVSLIAVAYWLSTVTRSKIADRDDEIKTLL